MENSTVKSAIRVKSNVVYKLGVDIFGIDPLDYAIDFSLTGKTAGMFCAKRDGTKLTGLKLRYNLKLAIENFEDFLSDTVPHEVAHLICRQKYPYAKPHGSEWQYIMRKLGYNPTRCHDYKVEPAKTRVSTKTNKAHCNCKTYMVTDLVYDRIKLDNLTGVFKYGYYCKSCHAKLKTGGLND